MFVTIVERSEKVKGILRHIVSVFLSAVVLIATSGFTVFHHTCNTSQTSELSVIVPDFSCEHFQEQKSEVPSCCANSDDPDDHKPCQDDNCCDTESYKVKLDITLKVVDLDKKFEYSSILNAGLEKNNNNIEAGSELNHIIVSNDLPPPLGGKSLLIFLHKLIIPDLSV